MTFDPNLLTPDDLLAHARRLESFADAAAAVAEHWTPQGEADRWRAAAESYRAVYDELRRVSTEVPEIVDPDVDNSADPGEGGPQ